MKEAGRQRKLRGLPSVDSLLQTPEGRRLADQYGSKALVTAVRAQLQGARQTILEGGLQPSAEALLFGASASLASCVAPTLVPVINGTGVIIHTNLGRAPLSRSAREALLAAASYTNVEYDLTTGRRGSRYIHAESLLCELTGAEASLVVNNNAAAVLLILTALCTGREVVISRGQLVEIGGGFRIPEVMNQSGAQLVEVGTTNRTYLRDYETAIGDGTAAFMRVHRSNFTVTGFTHEPALADLAASAHENGILLLDDLGSGSLENTASYGLSHEPTIADSISAGSDLVCASGDKLLGGPQSGIIVGRAVLVERLRRFPLLRAVRVDKTTIAALEATLRAYAAGRAVQEIPVWRMISASLEELDTRASHWAHELSNLGFDAVVVSATSAIGGGSLPGQTLPTRALAIRAPSAHRLAARLRASTPPIAARIQEDLVLLDPRTMLPELDDRSELEGTLITELCSALAAEVQTSES